MKQIGSIGRSFGQLLSNAVSPAGVI